MTRKDLHHRSLLAVTCALSLGLLAACDKGGGGGGASTAPVAGPPATKYDRAFDEFMDLPNQMGEQVAWAAKPIADAATLADEVSELRAEANIDLETFKTVFTAALVEGKVEVSADIDLGEQRAAVEASLARIKQVALDLKDLPNRVKAATKGIVKLGASSPKLALKATTELKGEIKIATGDEKVKLEADLASVKEMPNTVKAEMAEAKSVVTSLPAKAVVSLKNLALAIEGKPYENPSDIPVSTAAPAEDPAGQAAPPPTAPTGEAAPAEEAPAAEPVAAPTPVEVPSGAAGGAPPPGANAPAGVVDARVAELDAIANAAGERADWLTAADAWEESYVIKSSDQLLAYLTGDAATKAKDCDRAKPYLNRFLEYGDKEANAAEMAEATKLLGEMKAFECPKRTEDDEARRAETLALQGKALGEEDDWGGAAAKYAAAYQLDTDNHIYAYEVAVSSWNAHECNDATAYFNHFVGVATTGKEKAKARSARKYLARAEEGECVAWEASERDGLARRLYSEGQALEAKLDFSGAVGKYERAYHMLPDNHALAWRIAATEWKATHCEPADEYARIFVTKADPADDRYTDDIPKAQGIIAKVDALGCPDALWTAGDGDGGGAGGEAGGEAPPAMPPKQSGLCSVDPRGQGQLFGLGLFVLAAIARRRRRALP